MERAKVPFGKMVDLFSKTFNKETMNTIFSSIHYINLDKRTDRREYSEKTFKKLKIKAKRFSAIKGKKGKEARIACKNSHLSIIKESSKNKENNVLILEDDCLFVNGFEKYLTIFREIKSWDMIFLGHCFSSKKDKIQDNLFTMNKIFCTHAYAVNSTGYNKLIKHLENSQQAIDHIYNSLLNSDMKIYAICPSLVSQAPNKSDIGEGPNNSNNLLQ